MKVSEKADNKNQENKYSELNCFYSALSEIIKTLSETEKNIDTLLQTTLEKILAIQCLNVLPKGSIFITENDGNLKMIAEKDTGTIAEHCSIIKPGECLCGKALSEKKIQSTGETDENYKKRYNNTNEQGHLKIPVIFQNEVLGVINLYTKQNYEENKNELNFLQSVSDILAITIKKKKYQK